MSESEALPWDLLALSLLHVVTDLSGDSTALLLGNLPTHRHRDGPTLLSGHQAAPLPGHRPALGLGHCLALSPLDCLARLSGLVTTLLLGDL